MFSDLFVVWRRASQGDGTLRDRVCLRMPKNGTVL